MTHINVDEAEAHSGRGQIDRRDAFAGALVGVAGAVLFVTALSMEAPQAGNQQIGPSIFPLVISGLMTVLGVLIVGKALVRRPGSPAPSEVPVLPEGDHHLSEDLHHVVDEVHELMEEPPVPFRRLLIVLGLFVGYLAVLIPLGFIISTTLFMAAMTTFVAPEKYLRNALVAVGTSLVVYYCFSSLLGVELPMGLLGW